MIEFAIGVAVGAVFSPFWMKLFSFVKTKVLNTLDEK